MTDQCLGKRKMLVDAGKGINLTGGCWKRDKSHWWMLGEGESYWWVMEKRRNDSDGCWERGCVNGGCWERVNLIGGCWERGGGGGADVIGLLEEEKRGIVVDEEK